MELSYSMLQLQLLILVIPILGKETLLCQTVAYPVFERYKRMATPHVKWRKKYLTYRVSAYTTQNISRQYIDEELSKAFKLWEEHADLEFRKSSDFDVDIEIKFAKGEHGDPMPFFDHTLAHAFLPAQTGDDPLGGDIHFNDNYSNWQDGTTLLHTATHEIGHALGMPHSSSARAVMSPYQGNAKMPVILAPEDIEVIQALYGPPRVRFKSPVVPAMRYSSTTPKSVRHYSSTESEGEIESDNEIDIDRKNNERNSNSSTSVASSTTTASSASTVASKSTATSETSTTISSAVPTTSTAPSTTTAPSNSTGSPESTASSTNTSSSTSTLHKHAIEPAVVPEDDDDSGDFSEEVTMIPDAATTAEAKEQVDLSDIILITEPESDKPVNTTAGNNDLFVDLENESVNENGKSRNESLAVLSYSAAMKASPQFSFISTFTFITVSRNLILSFIY